MIGRSTSVPNMFFSVSTRFLPNPLPLSKPRSSASVSDCSIESAARFHSSAAFFAASTCSMADTAAALRFFASISFSMFSISVSVKPRVERCASCSSSRAISSCSIADFVMPYVRASSSLRVASVSASCRRLSSTAVYAACDLA